MPNQPQCRAPRDEAQPHDQLRAAVTRRFVVVLALERLWHVGTDGAEGVTQSHRFIPVAFSIARRAFSCQE